MKKQSNSEMWKGVAIGFVVCLFFFGNEAKARAQKFFKKEPAKKEETGGHKPDGSDTSTDTKTTSIQSRI
ncbi:hypothetical protein KUL152_34750 [Tenacibaculum sp. KUL152]|nr:hypothetical protein KUL152_34750 [Tenacibaculum sp. KUL152]